MQVLVNKSDPSACDDSRLCGLNCCFTLLPLVADLAEGRLLTAVVHALCSGSTPSKCLGNSRSLNISAPRLHFKHALWGLVSTTSVAR